MLSEKGETVRFQGYLLGHCGECVVFSDIILLLVLCSITLIALVFRLSSGAIQAYQSARDLEGST